MVAFDVHIEVQTPTTTLVDNDRLTSLGQVYEWLATMAVVNSRTEKLTIRIKKVSQ